MLDALLSGWGLDDRLHQYRALLVWEEVVGPQIAARTKPDRIRDGVLEVCVDQPTWMQQLQLLKPQILAKLNAKLGNEVLRDIFLKRGKASARPAIAGKTSPPRWCQVDLSLGETEELKAMLADVADAELRQELECLLVKQARLTRAKTVN